MDSITQAALGATVAGISTGRQTSKKVILWGALAGTLPDLDIIHSFFTTDVERLVSYRGVTHSFIVVPFVAYLLAKLFGCYNNIFAECLNDQRKGTIAQH